MTDPEDSSNIHNRSLENSRIFLSTIQEVIPHLNTYVIADPSPSYETLFAVRGDTGAGCIMQGTQSITTLLIGTLVVAALVPGEERMAVIIAAVPPRITGDLNITRSLVLRSCAGFVHDPAFRAVFENSPIDDTIVPDHSVGTPLDVLPGDWGYINETGLHVMIGRLRAVLGSNEMNRLEFFDLDDLARLSAWNYEHRGPGLDYRLLDDGGEYNEIRMLSPTVFEGQGTGELGNALNTPDGEIKQGQLDAYQEPTDQSQQGIFRHQLFRGFLGNGEKEYIAAISPTVSGPLRYEDKSPYVGLFEQSKGFDGSYYIKSAKEITLEKTIVIPVPKEQIIPEDELGDNPDSYKAAGVMDSKDGEAHQMDEYGEGELSPEEKIAALYDYHAYVYNKYNISPFVEHVKDWNVLEEDGNFSVKANWDGVETGIYKPGVISSTQFLYPKPLSKTLKIDDRENHNVKYYVSRSFIKQLDDGSILVEDGYGSQIKMTGGSIFMTCPGDIIKQPGRNSITMAPNDIIERAGSSVDITAAHHDVRIKAERNLHVLGGNSGSGGVLVESKGAGSIQGSQFEELGEKANAPGIIFKASESDVYIYGKNEVYVGVTEDTGVIVMDAKDGTIYSKASAKINLIALSYATQISGVGGEGSEFILSGSGGVITSALVTDTLAVVSEGNSAIAVNGGIFTEGTIAARGSIVAVGSIASEAGMPVGPVEGLSDQMDDVTDQLSEIAEDADDAVGVTTDSITEFTDILINNENSPANEETVKSVRFSCRTDEDYAIPDDFVLFEARWQQLYRTDQTGDKWDEPTIKGSNDSAEGETMPYPGIKAWRDDDEAYATIDYVNIDGETGFAKDRDALSKDKPEVAKSTLQDNYLISHQKQ